MLQEEASNIVAEMGLALLLNARVLDLRPRLLTENMSAATKKPKPARNQVGNI